MANANFTLPANSASLLREPLMFWRMGKTGGQGFPKDFSGRHLLELYFPWKSEAMHSQLPLSQHSFRSSSEAWVALSEPALALYLYQRQADLGVCGQPGVHSQFQASQGIQYQKKTHPLSKET